MKTRARKPHKLSSSSRTLSVAARVLAKAAAVLVPVASLAKMAPTDRILAWGAISLGFLLGALIMAFSMRWKEKREERMWRELLGPKKPGGKPKDHLDS